MPHITIVGMKHKDNVDIEKKGQIKILKLGDEGEDIDINILILMEIFLQTLKI